MATGNFLPPGTRHFVRVDKKTQLFFKTGCDPQWQELSPLTERNSHFPSKILPSIDDLTFDGGIQLRQYCQSKNDRTLYYQVRWEPHEYSGIWVDEYVEERFKTHENPTTIAVRFTPDKAPVGKAGKRIIPLGPAGNKAKIGEMEEQKDESASIVLKDIDQMSLPRLALNFEEDGYTELMLVFRRPRTAKGSCVWDWAPVVDFLVYRRVWIPTMPKHDVDIARQFDLHRRVPAFQQCYNPETVIHPAAPRGYWISAITPADLTVSPPPMRALSAAVDAENVAQGEVSTEAGGVSAAFTQGDEKVPSDAGMAPEMDDARLEQLRLLHQDRQALLDEKAANLESLRAAEERLESLRALNAVLEISVAKIEQQERDLSSG